MTITVEQVFKQFPSFKSEDMQRLTGKTNFNDNDMISLSRIASYQGSYAKELSIFTAKLEGQDFTNLLADDRRVEMNKLAGVGNENKPDTKNNIPMDKSIFDIPQDVNFA